ncbi:hypothetical protein S7335_4885 [Synechococcus sp. PCC 7335]|nr:hypothetical protein S7335_4885 [Synechococcus sp. PCC 7335]
MIISDLNTTSGILPESGKNRADRSQVFASDQPMGLSLSD